MNEGKPKVVWVIDTEDHYIDAVTASFKRAGFEVHPCHFISDFLQWQGFTQDDWFGTLSNYHGFPDRFPDAILFADKTSASRGADILAAYKGKGVGLVMMTSDKTLTQEDVKVLGGNCAELIYKENGKVNAAEVINVIKKSMEAAKLEKLGIIQTSGGRMKSSADKKAD